MKIAGMQKLTLIDYPGKVAATLFTEGCNFRCPFCHNAALVLPEQKPALLDTEEVLAVLKKRAGILDGVCVSGGEPLLQPDLPDFLQKIKSMGLSVKLDTNGSLPELLIALIRSGCIDYVAMDIKNSPLHYGKTVGIEGLDPSQIERSADFLRSGDNPVAYEFRTTVVRELHNADDFTAIGRRFAGAQQYFLQTFVDSGNVIAGGLSGYGREEMEQFRQLLLPYMKAVTLREI